MAHPVSLETTRQTHDSPSMPARLAKLKPSVRFASQYDHSCHATSRLHNTGRLAEMQPLGCLLNEVPWRLSRIHDARISLGMRMRIGSLAFMIMAGALVAPLALAADHPTLEARRKSLNRLLADEWAYELRESPELATLLGDYRCHDRWSGFSLGHVQW